MKNLGLNKKQLDRLDRKLGNKRKRNLRLPKNSERRMKRRALSYPVNSLNNFEDTFSKDILTLKERKVLEIFKQNPQKSIKNKNVNGKIIADLEPLWIDLIPIFIKVLNDDNKDFIIKELKKIAKVGDMVRQAQKKKEKIVFDFEE